MSEPSQFAPRRFEAAIRGRIAEDRFLEKAEDGTIASATPNRKRGKSMSFRSGQSGNVVPKGQMWHGRFYVDIPGEEKRVRTSVPIGSIHSMKKTEAKRKLRAMLEEMGLNSDRHLERATRGGKTFAAEASWWRENVLSKFKPSCQEAMGSHLDKYLIPHVGSLPMVAIDERRVQELITVLERAENGRVSMLQANGVPSDLVKLWVGHSNLETTSNYTHFPEEFRSKVARATGLFSQDVGPNGPNYREFPNTGRVM
jgi:hypothetical protein